MSERAKECAELLNVCFPSGENWSEAAIDHVLSRQGGYLFENYGGFLIAQAVLDEAEIWTLAVDPEKRRNGHARDLLHQAENTLRDVGVKSLFLEVAEDNSGALSLYESVAFIKTGRRKSYYKDADGNRVDAILMRKAL